MVHLHVLQKIKLSLCLTKHVMKASLSYLSTTRESGLGSGGICPRILNLGTRWR
jgi:hypothetical protein